MECIHNKEHEYRLEQLDDKVKRGEKALIEHKVRIEKVDEATKSVHKRTDELKDDVNEIKKTTETIYKLAISVENIAKNLESFSTIFKEHEERIDNLERMPGKNAYQLQKQIITYIVIAILGAFLGSYFKI